MKLLFFDLETTGTNPGRNGIHQISGMIEIDGETRYNPNFRVLAQRVDNILKQTSDAKA